MLTPFTHTYAVFSHQLSLIQTLPVHTHTHTHTHTGHAVYAQAPPPSPHTQAHSARTHHPCPEGATRDSSPWRPGPVEACELRGSRTGDRAQPEEGERLEARAYRQMWREPRPFVTPGVPQVRPATLSLTMGRLQLSPFTAAPAPRPGCPALPAPSARRALEATALQEHSHSEKAHRGQGRAPAGRTSPFPQGACTLVQKPRAGPCTQ